MSSADPSRCPLCLEANECAMARGSTACWCESASIPADVLERVPEPLKGVVCICRGCAEGAAAPPGRNHAL